MEIQNQSQSFAPQPLPENIPVAQAVVQIKYAGFWIRYVAAFIDGIIVSLLITFSVVTLLQPYPTLIEVAKILVSFVYYIWMTSEYQATLGKKAMGIMVISDKSEKLTFMQVFVRETIGKLLSLVTMGIGYLMIGFTERKQGLHDKMAGTLVIYKDPNKARSVLATIMSYLAIGLIIFGVLALIAVVALSRADALRRIKENSEQSLIAPGVENVEGFPASE